MPIHYYNAIYVALDFADKYGADTVTIETNEGEHVMSVDRAQYLFDQLAPGEPFSITNISFSDKD